MKKNLKIIALLFHISFLATAQNNGNFEIDVDSSSNPDIKIFQEKFNIWFNNRDNDSIKSIYNPERMIQNFIIFSEDGLIMKDLKFHSVESCKKKIIANLPQKKISSNQKDWIYVTLESQVNKQQLKKILAFLRIKNINYRFGEEDDFAPSMIKK